MLIVKFSNFQVGFEKCEAFSGDLIDFFSVKLFPKYRALKFWQATVKQKKKNFQQ